MALLYGDADLTPSKIDLLRAWVTGRPWAAGVQESTLDAVGAYRLDDPEGEVGIETHLLAAEDGRMFHVPLTYRGAPLESASEALVTTMEHSVLGRRWVYDACGDVVYARALLTVMITGGRQADLLVESEGRRTTLESRVQVRGSGTPGEAVPSVEQVSRRDEGAVTVMSTGDTEVVVRRRLDTDLEAGSRYALHGTWPGQVSPLVLAIVRAT